MLLNFLDNHIFPLDLLTLPRIPIGLRIPNSLIVSMKLGCRKGYVFHRHANPFYHVMHFLKRISLALLYCYQTVLQRAWFFLTELSVRSVLLTGSQSSEVHFTSSLEIHKGGDCQSFLQCRN